ncbi:SDR family oxidoreductase [Acuticoccus sp. I52.16.1]|uniref:SDR family oxidoreductase n=1 Tax=Acuticoccus sp. I52.16.1 TaxID=2928472 RepID=UPI001FD32B76|nr:SDR family oxidoreductase [Acuticoccus sp. I52.16.1]UOM35006.1 SDR family oxidoreductase [Acuticoccus sp. I52.16.1]
MTDLKGRTALVTGSVGGLGYALAEALAGAGANVVLNGLADPAEGAAVAEKLAAERGVAAAFDPTDLRDVGAIERMVAGTVERFGSLDVLVNNAVVRHFAPIEAFTAEAWDRSVSVNLSAAFHAVRCALPHMKRAGWGRIVNLSSYYGFRGAQNRVDYVTTKTALIGLTRAIAIECARDGVTANAIMPGSVPTEPILTRIEGIAEERGEPFEDVARAYAEERSPVGRFIAMENIGALLVFLCGPAAADITGTVMPIDGGWLAA